MCHDLTVFYFTKFCVVAKFPCRDTIFVVSHFDPWLQLPFYVVTSFGCLLLSFKLQLKTTDLLSSFVVTCNLGHDQVFDFIATLSVAT